MILVAPGRGYNSYFEMPFRKHCRITIENRGTESQYLFYMITGWRGSLPKEISYFHAAYRQEHPVQKGRSYVVADHISGKGRFVGVTLSVGVNGHNSCWVEGEAKMYLRGEEYPSINYTGTEDYFCGAYGFGNDIALKNISRSAVCMWGCTRYWEIRMKCTTRRKGFCCTGGMWWMPSTLKKALK